jgi:hypothetical protein
MVAGAPSLARVMHKQGEEEEVEPVDLRQQGSKALFPRNVRLAQGMNIVDDQEGMLVDRVAMIRIANDQRVDAVELGNQQLQNAQGMHGAKRVRGVWPEQYLPQPIPQKGSLRYVHIEHRECVGQAILCILRQPVAMRSDQGKHPQNTLRTSQHSGFRNIDAPVLDHEVGAGNGNPLTPLRPVERLPCRR